MLLIILGGHPKFEPHQISPLYAHPHPSVFKPILSKSLANILPEMVSSSGTSTAAQVANSL